MEIAKQRMRGRRAQAEVLQEGASNGGKEEGFEENDGGVGQSART
jgi:hypothetical protein